MVNIAFKKHKTVGHGLLERISERCCCSDVERKKMTFSSQMKVPIVYDKIIFANGLCLDLLADNSMVIEQKAQDDDHPIWEAQQLSDLQWIKNRFYSQFSHPIKYRRYQANDSMTLFVSLRVFAPSW